MLAQKSPAVTLALFSYNQESYIREAVEGALAQDYENLEIILSDDCSSDGTFSIVQSIIDDYKGPHKVILNKNSENRGLSTHFNKVMEMASGKIIVLAGGDDISLPDRVSKTVDAFNKHPNVMLVSFTDHLIDGEGLTITSNPCSDYNKYDVISLSRFISGSKTSINGASRGFRYELYKVFGALVAECPTEDTPYKMRGLMMGEALVFRAPGIFYRKHDSNLSGDASASKMNFEAITNQYKKDIKLAGEKGLISDDEKEKCISFILRDNRRRYLQRAMYEGRLYFFDFLIKILFRRDHSFREKAGLAKKIIFGSPQVNIRKKSFS